MPYYLNNASSASAGVNIPSVVIGATVGDYIEIKAVANSGNPSSNYRLAGQQSGFSNFIEIRPASAFLGAGGSGIGFTTSYTQPPVGSVFTVRFTRASSTTWRCTLNGSVLGADLFNSNNCTLDAFFRFASSTTEAFRGGIYYVAISTNGGASVTRYYDPSSTSSGTVLPDTINSANNGNQVGTWPSDNSEWVFYSSETYYLNNASSASAAINIPQIVIGATVGDYVEIKAVANSGNPTNTYRLFGDRLNSGFTNLVEMSSSQVLLRANSATNLAFSTGYTQPSVGAIFTLKIVKSSSTQWQAFLNGSSIGTATSSNTLIINGLFRISNTTTDCFRGGVYYVAISDNGGTSAARYYDPSASGGVGSTLVDVINNTNNGTQVGSWPADNSEWVPVGGGGTSWAGTIGKTSLSSVTKSLSINTGQSLSPNKVTLTVSSKQQSISTGFVATKGKTSLTLSPKQEAINVGYINTLSKLGLALLQKQLSITVGANLPFTGVIGKTTYALNGKQLGLALGWSGGVNKRNLSPITKQLNIAAGWSSGVVKSTLPVSNKQESVLAGFVNTINEINIPVNGKPLNLQTGTSISYIGTINKGSLNVSGKPLDVVTGTAIPFVGLMQKTSLTLTGKQLGVVRGQVLDLQKQALNIVGKQLSLGEIVYPIVPIERIFTIKDGDRIHYFKQTTTVYVMKNN